MWATHSKPFPSACFIQLISAELSDIPAYVHVSLWDSPGRFTAGSDSVRVWLQTPEEKISLVTGQSRTWAWTTKTKSTEVWNSPVMADSSRNVSHLVTVIMVVCLISGWWFGLSSVWREINTDGGGHDLHWLLLTMRKMYRSTEGILSHFLFYLF